MTKIKVVAALIFILSLSLAYFSKYISNENEIHLKTLKLINEQKAFTQEISKNIFYIYNSKNGSTKELDHAIKLFADRMNQREEMLGEVFSHDIQKQKTQIVKDWNNFYLLVQKFRDVHSVSKNAYTNLALESLVDEIYKANLHLVMEFDKLIALYKKSFEHFVYFSKIIQITLFVALLTLLIYLFSQLKELIAFIQRFLHTSKNIVDKKSIKEVETIETKSDLEDLSKAANNFNLLVEKIENSIEHSTESIANASKSLEMIEENIEDLLDFISSVDGKNSYDKEMIKKEDILIEALEELTSSLQNLQNLKKNLQNFKK
jgi:methyl-accepting chemotaxis protein